MKRLIITLAAASFTLAACSNGAAETESFSTSQTTSSATSKSPVATSSSSKTTAPDTSTSATPTASLPSSGTPPEPSQKAPQSSVPVQQPAQPVAPPEPILIECLEGTPGPALMSDGSIQYSDWCFHNNGGPEYIKEESRSCVGPPEFCNVAPDGTRYDGLDPVTGQPISRGTRLVSIIDDATAHLAQATYVAGMQV